MRYREACKLSHKSLAAGHVFVVRLLGMMEVDHFDFVTVVVEVVLLVSYLVVVVDVLSIWESENEVFMV